ncbi:ATP-binding cassette domain-containing protein [Falsiroseomonas selenitidurans]|uniref:ATP-binding cassette domain-containing protein n=1 Tax=Falsiroseomonas selenitidurans TaxID=2716335 RepID=A0ABX1DWN7_9PROT|nr:ATP-binding cassette domain-containing protein [Falsiroseomonas selenitidurans]NKC29344.1 ATP-binding cassette domain-containing protein [Falsiroseomonas selenitidurans]
MSLSRSLAGPGPRPEEAKPDPIESPPADVREVVEVARAEIAAAARLTLGLGLLISLATFGVVASKLVIWQLVLPTGNPWTLAGLAIAFCLAVGILLGLDQLRELGLLAVSHRLARRLAAPLVLAAAQQPGRSDLAAGQALRDVEELRRNLTGPVLTGIVDAVLVPTMILLLLFFHWGFTLWALGCCAAAALLSVLGDRLTRRAVVASNDSHARTSSLVADAMRCAEAVEAMGLRAPLAARWEARMQEGTNALRGAQAGARWVGAGLATIHGIGSGGALVVGTLLAAAGADVGYGMVVAMLVTGQIITPFARIGGASHEWGAALAAWRRLGELVRGDRSADNAIAFPCREARLVLDRVSFAHRGAPRALLREVSLQVAPGEVVALGGTAGAGKTTLLRIAMGMVRPSAGGCFLDGQATWQWAREDFARHVGYLPQDPLLTDGTVAEAIARLGVPDMPAVLEAARLADAHGLIAGLPAGYATPIRAEGPLSAGQRQRVALARALYHRPRLLVLDEPAAFLDAAGEQRLVRLLRQLAAQGVGVLFTSHRQALLAAADRVVMLRGGQLGQAPAGPVALPAPQGRAA